MRHTTKNLKNRTRLQKIGKKLAREAKLARKLQRKESAKARQAG
jgi:hypothetical protein